MKILVFISILVCMPAMLFADVIRLQNGQIFLGKVIRADSQGIVIESFGEQRGLSQADILKNEKDLTTLKTEHSDIYLKDGSVLKGKIENYDEEVGVLVNIDFGSVTLPVKSIKEINNSTQKKYYNGNPVQIGAGGGYYAPAGKMKNTYDAGYNYSIFAEFNSGLTRGLFIGGDLSYFPVDYKDNSKVSYNIFTLQPYLIYHFLFLRSGTSFIKDFVPFVTAGCGVAYVLMKDKRANTSAPEKSELDFAYSAKIGCDYQVTEKIILRVFGGWQTISQKSDSFNAMLINAGVLYSF
jgi:hypothetical protein